MKTTIIGSSLLGLLVAVVLGGCGAAPKGETLMDAVRTYNDGVRWERASREPVVPAGEPGSSWEGGVYAGCGLAALAPGEWSLPIGPQWHTHNHEHFAQGRMADPPHRGISILLVEPGPGLTVSRDLPKLGYKGVESCEVVLDGHRTDAAALLGGVAGRGFAQMMRGLEIGRVQVAARALGVGRTALGDALRYAHEREAFGKPIWQHQAVGHRLADMATRIEAAHHLVLHAASLRDAGIPCLKEAAMAKLNASEMAERVCSDAIQIHGGYGYLEDFPVERIYRDVRVCQIYEGTSDIQRLIISRKIATGD